jgi:Fe2+ or Zn2+ uptake regulation protein
MKKESFIARLRQKGLKVTPQRIALIEALEKIELLHPSVHQIHREAKKKAPNLSLSTTYAALKEFSRLHMIKTLQFDRAENRYESDLSDHANLICEECGNIIDFDPLDPALRTKIARQTGFLITDSRLEFYGVCRVCISAKEKEIQKKTGSSRSFQNK